MTLFVVVVVIGGKLARFVCKHSKVANIGNQRLIVIFLQSLIIHVHLGNLE